MTVRIRKIGLKKICFILAYTIYFVARYMEYTSVISNNGTETVINCIKIVTYCIFAGLILLRDKISIIKNGEYELFILIVMGITIYQIFWGRGNSIFVIILIGLAYYSVFKDGNIERFIQANLALNILMFTTVIILNIFNVLPNIKTSVFKAGNITFNRSSLGFIYPGQLQIACLTLVTLLIYLTRNKNSRLFKIVSFVLSTVIFAFSQTIMPYLMSLLAIIIIKNKKTPISRKHVLLHLATLCFAITVIIVVLKYFSISAVDGIDTLMNYRLSLSVTAIRKYGITMLGTPFHNINEGGLTGEYLYLDSEYMYMLISNGIIYSVFALIILKILNAYMLRTYNFATYSVLIVWYINGIVNSGIFNILFNPFIICILPAIKNYFIKIKDIEVGNGQSGNYPC